MEEMNCRVDDSGKEAIVTITGSLTIRRANELKDVLMTAFSQVDSVRMHFDRVTEIDLACLQLLCAAHQTSLRKNKKLRISGNRIDLLRKTLNEAGYTRLIKFKNPENQ